MDSQETGIKTWQWVVTAVVIIILIIIGIMVFGRKGAEAPASVNENPTPSVVTTTPAGSIVMADQFPGNVVYLSSVQLAKDGWVVIQKDNKGQPGAVIGSKFVSAGISPVQIKLSSPMVDGGTYYAVLYTGINATKFDSKVEKPLTDSNGSTIMKVFKASVTAGEGSKG